MTCTLGFDGPLPLELLCFFIDGGASIICAVMHSLMPSSHNVQEEILDQGFSVEPATTVGNSQGQSGMWRHANGCHCILADAE